MATSHKAQHWIPKSHLSAWTDPDCLLGQEPFVHVFSRDGSEHKRRAPVNLFTETDLYTVKMPDGRRDLRLEHGLSDLERSFAAMRLDFLAHRRSLPAARYVKLLAFVAAMHARTPMLRDHHMKFWTEVLEKMEHLDRSMRGRSVEEKKRASALSPPTGRRTATIGDVRKVVESPMENTLIPYVQAELPLLLRMRAVVLCTNSDVGFITSDSPVVWFDPEGYKRPPLYRGPAFMYPTLEITFPLSPQQLLMLVHGDTSLEYVSVGDAEVTELNRRTRGHCEEYFVGCRSSLNPIWLDPGTPPPDAWKELAQQ